MCDALELNQSVIENGYCIGCGICSAFENSPFKVRLNEYGYYTAYLDKDCEIHDYNYMDVCPFSDKSLNEDEISENLYRDFKKHSQIGSFINCYAGYVFDDSIRSNSSSGGCGKWLGYRLLSKGYVEHYVHVVSVNRKSEEVLFDYTIVSQPEEVLLGSKSAYYPITLSSIIREIKAINGRFAITGLPCFIKAIRLLTMKDEELNSKIRFLVGLFCGGMKSANHAKLIGWQLGIEPTDIGGIDFRMKSEDHPASEKIYQVWNKNGKVTKSEFSDKLFGTGWSGYFTPKSCFFCDDVVSETSDVSIGDAWLPKYVEDSKGTSIIIVRNQIIQDILQEAVHGGDLYLDEITADEVAKSQAGGFRQRRDALSYRLNKLEKRKEWYPAKRIKPNEFKLSSRRKRVYKIREQIAQYSTLYYLKAYYKKDLYLFTRKMRLIKYKYYVANKGGIKFIFLLLNQVKMKLRSFINRHLSK